MGETDPKAPGESVGLLAEGNWSVGNWLVILVFVVLTVVGVAMTAGLFGGDVLTTSIGTETNGIGIPLAVFLYATLGALGYVFTRLMTALDDYDEWSDIENLAEMGMRIPAAWLLAAGVFQFGSLAVGSASLAESQLVTGVPFLVGLYVNVAYRWLGGLADRLLGRQLEADAAVTEDAESQRGHPRADGGIDGRGR